MDSKTVEVTFFPWSFEGDDPEDADYVLPKALRGFKSKQGDKFPKIIYKWDGEQFVRDTASKPLAEYSKYLNGDVSANANNLRRQARRRHSQRHLPVTNTRMARGWCWIIHSATFH